MSEDGAPLPVEARARARTASRARLGGLAAGTLVLLATPVAAVLADGASISATPFAGAATTAPALRAAQGGDGPVTAGVPGRAVAGAASSAAGAATGGGASPAVALGPAVPGALTSSGAPAGAQPLIRIPEVPVGHIDVTADDIGGLTFNPWWLTLGWPRWVTFGHSTTELPTQVKSDMATIRAEGASGILTYSEVPNEVIDAQKLGLKVILGINNPLDPAEIAEAITLARTPGTPIVAIMVGNEGIKFGRYNTRELGIAMTAVRTGSKLPVGTSEPEGVYERHPELFSMGDFLLPNILPVYYLTTLTPLSQGCNPPTLYASYIATQTVNYWNWMQSVERGARPIIAKEVGLPTAGDCRLSEAKQAQFFCDMHADMPIGNWMHFNSDDNPTKPSDGFAFDRWWGLLRPDGSVKPAGTQLLRC